MIKTLKKVNHITQANITLPASKSISNRLLVLQKLYHLPINIQNLSDSDDTKLLYNCLYSETTNPIAIEWDVENCGTAMRFLVSYAAITKGNYILYGNERMQQRPVKPLVDGWRALGAEINYIEKEGYPPLHIGGKTIIGYPTTIEIDGSMSSQFISSIMMAGCALEKGLNIQLTGIVSSKPYIQMTLKLMQELGLDIIWDEEKNIIQCKHYSGSNDIIKDYHIESDWSAASYCYLWALAIPGLQIDIDNLSINSLQGDSVLMSYFEKFGLSTNEIHPNNISIIKDKNFIPQALTFDCSQCLDIAPTLALAAFITHTKVTLTGLENLKHKESDRLKVLYTELNKFSPNSATIISDDVLYIHRTAEINYDGTLETYGDHRIAMAFSVLAAYGDLKINNPEVVSKSFPSFWDEIRKVGLGV